MDGRFEGKKESRAACRGFLNRVLEYCTETSLAYLRIDVRLLAWKKKIV